jgi:Zn-dependent alcohol dehydrogenase
LGDVAVVVGAGMIGLVTLQAAKAAGCALIIAVDMEYSKLEVAMSLGATDGLNPKRVNVPNAADPAARLVRVEWRISAVHRHDGTRNHQGRAVDFRGRAAGRWSCLV